MNFEDTAQVVDGVTARAEEGEVGIVRVDTRYHTVADHADIALFNCKVCLADIAQLFLDHTASAVTVADAELLRFQGETEHLMLKDFLEGSRATGVFAILVRTEEARDGDIFGIIRGLGDKGARRRDKVTVSRFGGIDFQVSEGEICGMGDIVVDEVVVTELFHLVIVRVDILEDVTAVIVEGFQDFHLIIVGHIGKGFVKDAVGHMGLRLHEHLCALLLVETRGTALWRLALGRIKLREKVMEIKEVLRGVERRFQFFESKGLGENDMIPDAHQKRNILFDDTENFFDILGITEHHLQRVQGAGEILCLTDIDADKTKGFVHLCLG